MKKLKLLLTLLLVAVGAKVWGQVTLNNHTVYSIRSGSGGNYLVSKSGNGNIYTHNKAGNSTYDPNDENFQWIVFDTGNGNYVLYSVAKRAVANDSQGTNGSNTNHWTLKAVEELSYMEVRSYNDGQYFSFRDKDFADDSHSNGYMHDGSGSGYTYGATDYTAPSSLNTNSAWVLEPLYTIPEYSTLAELNTHLYGTRYVEGAVVNGSGTGASHRPQNITLSCSSSENKTVTWATTNNFARYIDLHKTQVFEVTPGESVNIAFSHTRDNWYHSYVYLDADQNGFVVADANAADLVGYSYYNGRNSSGETLASGEQNPNKTFTFTAPTQPGDYRLRAKCDWNCIDPTGTASSDANALQKQGGGILDITLRVRNMVVINPANGTYTNGDGNSVTTGYFQIWTSKESTWLPNVTFSLDQRVNNMDIQNGKLRICIKNNGFDYRVRVPNGYLITGYTLTGTSDGDITITSSNGGTHTFVNGTASSMSETGMDVQEFTFTGPNNNARFITIDRFVIDVVAADEEVTCVDDNGSSFVLLSHSLSETSDYQQWLENKVDFYNFVSLSEPTVADGITHYTMTVENNFPFRVARRVESGFDTRADIWYTLNLKWTKDLHTRYAVRQDGTYIRTNSETRQLNANYLWAFVKVDGTPDTFELYNMGQGLDTEGGLDINNTAALGVKSDNYATFTDTKTVNRFRVVKKDGGYFLLQNPDDVNHNLGRHSGADKGSGDANTYLGFWTAAASQLDPGSMFNVTPAAELCDFGVAEGDPHTAALGYVGAYLNANNPIQEAYEAFANQNTYQSLRALMEAVAANPNACKTIDANSYYQLIPYTNDAMVLAANPYKNTDGSTMSNNNADNRGLYIDSHAPTPMTLLRFEAVGSNYNIEHVNSNFWFANLNAFNCADGRTPQVDLPINRPADGIEYYTNNERGMVNVWSLHCTTNVDKYLTANITSDDGGTVVAKAESPSTNDGALWYIREVTHIVINVADNDWATLCLPVSVNLPDVGEFYYCPRMDGDILELEQITAGTLAAGVPIVMRGATQYDFVVRAANAEAAYTPTTNYLSGTTARRQGFNAEGFNFDTYALANGASGVGFYRTTTPGIPANKAYYTRARQTSGPSNAPMYLVRWGEDVVTGLQTLTNDAQRGVLYDLNGRAVAFPTSGIYVDSTGRKLLVR